MFKNAPDWKVLDKKEDTRSGFFAYSFVNIREHRIVVAMQGSRNPLDIAKPKAGQGVIKDWGADVAAIGGGAKPRQFDVAERYVANMRKRYGARFSIDCSGHSMGGGACVYAAAKLPGVHGVAIDPISHDAIGTENAYLIDNYIVLGDLPNIGHRITERGMTGWQYKVTGADTLGSINSGISQTTPAVEPTLGANPIARHSVDRAINAIGVEAGLTRYDRVE